MACRLKNKNVSTANIFKKFDHNFAIAKTAYIGTPKVNV